MQRKKQNKKQVQIVIVSVLCILLIMTIGYAAFSTSLTLTAKGNIKEVKAAWQLKQKVVTTGEGLYSDTYETGRYVYKGDNPNNYITFNGEPWRIMSVETDGTLKVIRTGTGNYYGRWDGTRCEVALNKKNKNGNGKYAIDNIIYLNPPMTGDYGGCNNWARPAQINTGLNSKYYNELQVNAKDKIQSHAFGIGSVTWNNADLAGQIASENGTKWTGNIGLMSVSDYLRANTNTAQCGDFSLNNTNYETCKTTNYIYDIISFFSLPKWGVSWTISPVTDETDGVVTIEESGKIGAEQAGILFMSESDFVYLPALYLKSDITLSGEGTSSSPYIIA